MLLRERAGPSEGIACLMIRSHCTIRPCMYFGFGDDKKQHSYFMDFDQIKRTHGNEDE